MRSVRWGIVRPALVTEFLRSCVGGKAASISANGVGACTFGVGGWVAPTA